MSNLPKTVEEWKGFMKAQRLEHASLPDYPNLRSASDIDFNQFLLRVIYPIRKTAAKFLTERDQLIKYQSYTEAKSKLSRQESWKLYLKQLEQPSLNRDVIPGLGTFPLVFYYFFVIKSDVTSDQLSTPKVEFKPIAQRTRQAVQASSSTELQLPVTPTPATRAKVDLDIFGDLSIASALTHSTGVLSPASPALGGDAYLKAIDDEQIVNAALVLFLNAITVHFKIKADWTLHRRRFLYSTLDKKKVYEARVDGFLRTRQDNEVKAILEVKPFIRSKMWEAIHMQEAAQMAAWISEHPPADLETVRKSNGKFR